MTVENGIGLKEARTGAGLSQAALAKAAGVTVANISKAERGIKELNTEQLKAVAKVLGVASESIQAPAPAAEDTLMDVPAGLTADDLMWLDLYRTAEPDKQKAAVSLLKGVQENPELTNMLAGILKGTDPKELWIAGKNIISGFNVGELFNIVKKLMSSKNGGGIMNAFMGMSGGRNDGGSSSDSAGNPSVESNESRNGKEISVPLLAFTYFYSASIYILLLSFYFWLWRTDIKPDKNE